ncbi:MAG TPA: DUF222 domain-containing protein [Candidatus Dormibacteraeota bacterium]
MMGEGGNRQAGDASIARKTAAFLGELFQDLEPEDYAQRLVLERQVADYVELRFSIDAAALVESRAFNEGDPGDDPVHWLRQECKMQYGVAADRLNVGKHLGALTKSADAVTAGEIGFAHLSVMASTLRSVERIPAEIDFPEDELLEKAKCSTPGRFWHYCVRVRHALNAAAVAEEQRIAAEERWLKIMPLENGCSLISGQLDSIGAATLRTALEPLAQRSGQGDDRCLDRRQADALVEMATLALDGGRLPHRASQRPHLQVTTTLETLRGLSGSPAADLEFSQPVSSQTVQRIACDSSIARVVFGPAKVVLEAGRARRVVSGAMRRALNARDEHCQWPGCERPASWTAAHHLVHWVAGGATDLSNLVLLCLRHHWMVHEGGWQLVRATDGELRSVAPSYDFLHPARAPDQLAAA